MMPKMNGAELLRAVRAISPSVDVVMMTAFGTSNAVECMRAGAYDFITKPLKLAMAIRAVQRALERGALIRENANLRQLAGEEARESFALRFCGLNPLCETLKTVAPARVPSSLMVNKAQVARISGRRCIAGRVAESFHSLQLRAVPADSLRLALGDSDDARGIDVVVARHCHAFWGQGDGARVQTRLILASGT